MSMADVGVDWLCSMANLDYAPFYVRCHTDQHHLGTDNRRLERAHPMTSAIVIEDNPESMKLEA